MTASFKTVPTSGKAGGAPLAFTFSSGAFTYVYWDVTLTLSIGTLYSITITLNPVNQALFSIPASWSSAIPNSTSGTLTATLKSVPKPGSPETSTVTQKRTIAIQVADDAIPTMSTPQLTRINGPVPSGWGVYVQGKSQVQIGFSGNQAYGSPIKSRSVTIDGVTKTSTNNTSAFVLDLPTAGTRTVTARVKDSRGREGVTTTTLTVIAYAPPTLTSPSVWRANSGGTKTDNGTYGAFKALAGFASVSGKNSISYASSYKEIPSGSAVNIGTWVSNTNKVFGSGGLATTKSYLVTITITDGLGVAKSWSGVVPSERIPISFLAGGNGVAIGKAATAANWLEIALGTRIQNGTVTHEITGAGIHSASPTGDQPFHQVSTSTDVEPSFRLVRNGNNYGRIYQTVSSSLDSLALEAGDRSAGTPARLYLREDGRAMIVPPDGVWRYLPWGAWAGRFNMTGLTQNNTGTLAITFPTGVFSMPVVVPSVDTRTPQSVVCSANNISASGCNLNVRRSDTVSTATVHVIVMQYAP
ncbi:hypothetical protein [Corynebacterium variabile]|uniref:hypothetical protein n=1 Tax=Corynebacterium variabile TaxID=1727 RepID=UPI003BB1F39B